MLFFKIIANTKFVAILMILNKANNSLPLVSFYANQQNTIHKRNLPSEDRYSRQLVLQVYISMWTNQMPFLSNPVRLLVETYQWQPIEQEQIQICGKTIKNSNFKTVSFRENKFRFIILCESRGKLFTRSKDKTYR